MWRARHQKRDYVPSGWMTRDPFVVPSGEKAKIKRVGRQDKKRTMNTQRSKIIDSNVFHIDRDVMLVGQRICDRHHMLVFRN